MVVPWWCLMVERYDVFLSHCSADKPAVEAIAVRLRDEAGLRPFLDKWALVPGESWMPALERGLERSTTVAVFFGTRGRGAWHEQESQLALVLAAQEGGKRVIPVLLPGARKEDAGGFMGLRTWVELAEADGFAGLVAGVTGRAPGPGAGVPVGAGVEPARAEPSPAPAGQDRPSVVEHARIDNRGANIGQVVTVHGPATFGPMTMTMPSPSTAPSPGATPAAVITKPAVILLCTANAAHPGHRLRLEEELRAIDDALQRSRQRQLYAPRMCPAVTFAKVLHELDDHEPTFVHFSGHGVRSGELILKGERSEELFVPPERIAELLEVLPKRPTLVTFATCHSRALAEAAAQHAEFAIGFDGEIDDESAPLFSATLYERLASREEVDVARAFRLAVIACRVEGHGTVELARLFEYPGRAVEWT